MTPIVIEDEQTLAEFRSTRFSVSALTPLIDSNRIILASTPRSARGNPDCSTISWTTTWLSQHST